MRDSASRHLRARQRGVALLALLALVSVMVIFAYVTGLNRSAASMAQARAQRTTTALAQAKEALIAYAVTNADDPSHANPVPGFLPCPDLGPGSNAEGVTASSNCNNAFVSSLGKLPWKTLGLGAITDGSGECLWYAVSGTYKYNRGVTTVVAATSNTMNWDTNGQFAVKAGDGTTYLAGTAADNRAVAVIFAPGGPLSGQDRGTPSAWLTPNNLVPACGGNYTAAAYLETANGVNNSTLATPSSPANATDVSSFIASTSSDTFNDQLVYITRADIWNAIKKRSDFQNNLRALTRRAAECIAIYGTENNLGASDKRLPWASNVSLSDYVVDSRFRDTNGNLSGRLPYQVSVSVPATGNNSVASPYYLLSNASNCAYGLSPVNEQVWYDHWKDHLFYAIANNFRPSATPGAGCGTCLTINGPVNGNYAAVVIFAGEKLSGQSRNSTADKALIGNYLEGRNASNHPNSGGNSDYQAAAADGTFNDIVYALDPSLRVWCYSGSSMAPAPAADPAPLSPPGGAPHFPAGGATPPPGLMRLAPPLETIIFIRR